MQQARGARSLSKFTKYHNKKKSEKQIFTQKEIFKDFQNLNQSEEKSKNHII